MTALFGDRGLPILVHMGELVEDSGDTATTKTMPLRYAGICRDCGSKLPARTVAVYDKARKNVQCLECHAGKETITRPAGLPGPRTAAPTATTPIATDDGLVETGTAGASARREFDRRRAKREARVRDAHPRLGGLILALSDDPQSTRAWDAGARGEEALGRGLDQQAGKGVRVLHDRRIRGTKANIDHIVIGPSGVFAVDAKRYAGKRPTLRVEGGILRPRVEKLLVGSSDRTKLVEGARWQVAKLRAALDDAGFEETPVTGVLCFLDADWPLIGGSFTIDGIAVLWPKALYARLTTPRTLGEEAIARVHRSVAAAFPVA